MIPLQIKIEYSDGGEPVVHAFTRSPVTLGRADGCDVIIPLDCVSKLHGSFEFDDAGVSFTDHGSANGTLVDGREAMPDVPVPVDAGAAVSIAGKVVLTLSRDTILATTFPPQSMPGTRVQDPILAAPTSVMPREDLDPLRVAPRQATERGGRALPIAPPPPELTSELPPAPGVSAAAPPSPTPDSARGNLAHGALSQAVLKGSVPAGETKLLPEGYLPEPDDAEVGGRADRARGAALDAAPRRRGQICFATPPVRRVAVFEIWQRLSPRMRSIAVGVAITVAGIAVGLLLS